MCAVAIKCIARYLQAVACLAQVEVLRRHGEDGRAAHHHVDWRRGALSAEGVEGRARVLACMRLVHLDNNEGLVLILLACPLFSIQANVLPCLGLSLTDLPDKFSIVRV